MKVSLRIDVNKCRLNLLDSLELLWSQIKSQVTSLECYNVQRDENEIISPRNADKCNDHWDSRKVKSFVDDTG